MPSEKVLQYILPIAKKCTYFFDTSRWLWNSHQKFSTKISYRVGQWISMDFLGGTCREKKEKEKKMHEVCKKIVCCSFIMAIWVVDFSNRVYKISKNFAPKGNYWILRIGLMGSLSSFQKLGVLTSDTLKIVPNTVVKQYWGWYEF